MNDSGYVHGYTREEEQRLVSQSLFLEPWVYEEIDYARCSRVLEVGCGVGAQLKILARRFPQLKLAGIDHSESQLAAAREVLREELAAGRVELHLGKGERLPFPDGAFDGVFLCWILEHATDPIGLLRAVRRVLAPGSVLYATEVHCSSIMTVPEMPQMMGWWRKLMQLQKQFAGDADIGVRLGSLLVGAGFREITVRPVVIPMDDRMEDPEARQRYVSYWRELYLSAKDGLFKAGLANEKDLSGMLADFDRLGTTPGAIYYADAMQASARV